MKRTKIKAENDQAHIKLLKIDNVTKCTVNNTGRLIRYLEKGKPAPLSRTQREPSTSFLWWRTMDWEPLSIPSCRCELLKGQQNLALYRG